MGPAIPLVGAGLGLADTLIGSSQQGKSDNINAAQLQELLKQQGMQDQIRQSLYGRIQSQPQGNPQNPFSAQYGKPLPNLDPGGSAAAEALGRDVNTANTLIAKRKKTFGF